MSQQELGGGSLGDVSWDPSSEEILARAMERAGMTGPRPVSDHRMDLDMSDPKVIAFFEALEGP